MQANRSRITASIVAGRLVRAYDWYRILVHWRGWIPPSRRSRGPWTRFQEND